MSLSTSPSSGSGPTRNQHGLFVIVTLLYWASLYTYVPVLSPYLEYMGIPYGLVGLVLGSYGLTQIVLRLPLGITSDRMKLRKPFIVLGMLATTLSCLCFAFDESFGWALAGRILSGVGASCWAAFTVLYASFFKENQTTKAMGLISLLTVAGQLAAMSVSGYLVKLWGWGATFWAGALIGLAGLVLSLWLREPKETAVRVPIELKDLMTVMKEPGLLKISLLSVLAHSILFITMFGFTPSYALALGASEVDLTWLVFAFMIPHAVSSYISGRSLAPRYGSWNWCSSALFAARYAVRPFSKGGIFRSCSAWPFKRLTRKSAQRRSASIRLFMRWACLPALLWQGCSMMPRA
jgi:predicted MFS family arabinose efflux permease